MGLTSYIQKAICEMVIVNQDEVQKCLAAQKAGLYSEVLERMERGMALRFGPGEWQMRTPLPLYFLGKYNRGKKTVSVRKVGQDWLVVNL